MHAPGSTHRLAHQWTRDAAVHRLAGTPGVRGSTRLGDRRSTLRHLLAPTPGVPAVQRRPSRGRACAATRARACRAHATSITAPAESPRRRVPRVERTAVRLPARTARRFHGIAPAREQAGLRALRPWSDARVPSSLRAPHALPYRPGARPRRGRLGQASTTRSATPVVSEFPRCLQAAGRMRTMSPARDEAMRSAARLLGLAAAAPETVRR